MECLRRLVNSVGQSARAVEQRTGITNAQLYLLRQIAGKTGLSINELAARALTQQSTVSLLVGRLERAGYVRRQRSAADGRRVEVGLTPRGRALLRRAPNPPMARMLRAIETLPDRDVEAIIRGLGALLTAMRAPLAIRPVFELTGAPRRRARA